MSETEYTIQPALVMAPDDTRTFDVDFYDKCANLWRANEDVEANEYLLPPVPNGFAYVVTVAGRTAAKPPRFPTTIDETVASGSATLQCKAASAGGISAVSAPSVVSDPTGLTVSAVSVVESRKIRCTVALAVDEQDVDYDLVYSFTLDGVARTARLKVQVRVK